LGSLKNSAAATLPPIDVVYARTFWSCPGAHCPCSSRTPGLMANDVTSFALAAFANSTTPRHCARVSTPPKPVGGAAGGGASESWKYVELAQVPLTRT
jgi:hypothetical protein